MRRKVLDWLKARWKWVAGGAVGLLALVALSLKTCGGTPEVEHEQPIPPPPPPVPQVLEVEAGNAATEAAQAREAPSSMSASEVSAGFERHRRRP